MIENLMGFIVSAIFLVVSGIFLVKSLSNVSRFLKIPEFIAAFLIMAIATSLPELLVGITSAIEGNPGLSLGNILGANIIDLTLIIGIFIILSRGIEFEKKKMIDEFNIMIFSIFLLFSLYLIGNSLSRIDGVILLAFFTFNLYRVYRKNKRYPSKFGPEIISRKEGILASFIFMASLVVLFLSSRYAVHYAINLAYDLNVPQLIIGLFLLSIATTLPELIFGVNAVLLKHESMSIGDQVGTVFTNICLILGVVSIISPIEVELMPFLSSGFFLLFSGIVLANFIKSSDELSIKEGLFLILIYVAFVVIELFFK